MCKIIASPPNKKKPELIRFNSENCTLNMGPILDFYYWSIKGSKNISRPLKHQYYLKEEIWAILKM